MLTYTTTHEVPNIEHPVPGLPGWHVHIIYDEHPENPQESFDTLGVIEDTDRATAESVHWFDPERYAEGLREKHGATVVRALKIGGGSQPYVTVCDPSEVRSTDHVSAWQYDTPEGRSTFGRDGDGNHDWIVGMLDGELETYRAWVEGEVYAWILHDPDDVERDSCYGYYGDEGHDYALQAALDVAYAEAEGAAEVEQ